MSDPVSNAEIEDVLSSIRRLVSVEDRADASGHEHSDTSDVMASDRSQTIADNRLVLTPALRVDASETPPQADAESPADEGDADHFDADQDTPEGAPEAPALRFSHTDYDHDPQGTADETADRQNADHDDSASSDDGAQVDVEYV